MQPSSAPEQRQSAEVTREKENRDFDNWLCEDNTEFWDNMSQMHDSKFHTPKHSAKRARLKSGAVDKARSSPRLSKK